MKISEIMKMSVEIQNFYDCYNDLQMANKLYTRRPLASDGVILAEDLLEFLIENPHLAEIALKIKESK